MPTAWQGGKLHDVQAMGHLWVTAPVPGQGDAVFHFCIRHWHNKEVTLPSRAHHSVNHHFKPCPPPPYVVSDNWMFQKTSTHTHDMCIPHTYINTCKKKTASHTQRKLSQHIHLRDLYPDKQLVLAISGKSIMSYQDTRGILHGHVKGPPETWRSHNAAWA